MVEKLKFFDVKGKTSFTTDKFTLTTRSGRRFAVAKAPSGIQAFRIVKKGFKK